MSSRNLDKRREVLLQGIVEYYMSDKGPVGSKNLKCKCDLPWSSATLRYEMARLEDDGFLKQCHTSSGRLPTTQGIRYYVDYLLEPSELPLGVRQGVAERVEKTDGQPLRRLLILSQFLSRFSGAMCLLQFACDDFRDHVVTGKENFLGWPEFSDSLKLRDLLRLVEQEDFLLRLFRSSLTACPAYVAIGHEAMVLPYGELFEDVSVVSTSYGSKGKALGCVGVIGPKHMNYPQVIPLVDYVARSMGHS